MSEPAVSGPVPVAPVGAVGAEGWRGRVRPDSAAYVAHEAAMTARLTRIAELEAQLAGLQAQQVALAAAFVADRVGFDDAHGFVSDAAQYKAMVADIAIAKRVSISTAAGFLDDAYALATAHPATMAALAAGRIGLSAARAISAATTVLDPAGTGLADRVLADDAADVLPGQVRALAERVAWEVDPDAANRRARRERADRHLVLSPAGAGMAWLSAYLPAEDAVAAHTALREQARRHRAAGDARPQSQLMCDLFTHRLTGTPAGTSSSRDHGGGSSSDGSSDSSSDSSSSDGDGTGTGVGHGGGGEAGVPAGVPAGVSAGVSAVVAQINLVMTDQTLLGLSDQPAHLVGAGPVPADVARRLAGSGHAWLRRFGTDPVDGSLTAGDTHRRRIRLHDPGWRHRLLTDPLHGPSTTPSTSPSRPPRARTDSQIPPTPPTGPTGPTAGSTGPTAGSSRSRVGSPDPSGRWPWPATRPAAASSARPRSATWTTSTPGPAADPPP